MERYTLFNLASSTMSPRCHVFFLFTVFLFAKTGSYMPAFGCPASLT